MAYIRKKFLDSSWLREMQLSSWHIVSNKSVWKKFSGRKKMNEISIWFPSSSTELHFPAIFVFSEIALHYMDHNTSKLLAIFFTNIIITRNKKWHHFYVQYFHLDKVNLVFWKALNHAHFLGSCNLVQFGYLLKENLWVNLFQIRL